MTPLEKLAEVGWTTLPGGCWEYNGRRDPSGYGIHAHIRMHRVSFELHKGPIPDGLLVRHTCDNPPCINPEHLITGTRADNVADMIARGRHWHQRQTHCIRGHEFNEENTRITKNGNRRCRPCSTWLVNEWRAKQRVAA